MTARSSGLATSTRSAHKTRVSGFHSHKWMVFKKQITFGVQHLWNVEVLLSDIEGQVKVGHRIILAKVVYLDIFLGYLVD